MSSLVQRTAQIDAKTSILIVNWNGMRFLAGCLNSIAQMVTVPYEIVLVDNNSSDGSAEYLAEFFPQVKLVRSTDNLGFVGGSNLAAQHASGKYLLLLNNDTILQTDIRDAVLALDGDDRIGAVGASMFDGNGVRQPSGGHFPIPRRLWRFASMWDFAGSPWPSSPEITLRRSDRVDGSFLLTRADRWHAVGGLDERNYMYGDDVDYCRTLLNLGLVSVQCPSVRYTHFCGYNHSRMPYIFGAFRRYHRKFSSRRVQMETDFILRFGLLLRLPWYWLRAQVKKDSNSRTAFATAVELNRNWAYTLVDGHRFHS